MNYRVSILAAAVLFPQIAQADITSTDVWENLQDQISSAATITATTTASDRGLSIDKLIVKSSTEYILASTQTIELVDLPDGTVRIDLPSDFAPRLGTPEGRYIIASLQSEGLSLIASGKPDKIAYDLAAQSLTVALDERSQKFSGRNTNEVAFADPKAHVVLSKTQTTNIDADMSASKLTFGAVEQQRYFAESRHNWVIDQPKGTFTATLPAEVFEQDADIKAINDLALDFRLEYALATQIETYSRKGQDITSLITSDTNLFQLSIQDGDARLALGAQNLTTPIKMNQIPVPHMNITAGSMHFDLTFPYTYADTPRDFDLELTFGDVALGNLIWNMIDVERKLPRDPITLSVALTGTGKFSFKDPNLPKALSGLLDDDRLTSLQLRSFKLGAVGAELTSNGTFAFDHTDKTPGTPPRVDGTLEATLQGGFALLDTLVSLGVVPNQQAILMKTMSGLFAEKRPNDTLKSTIQIKPNGAITANGKRIR